MPPLPNREPDCRAISQRKKRSITATAGLQSRPPQGLIGRDLSDSQADSDEIAVLAAGMRAEGRVSSPEPAVGVFTTAGTCQGRLRRHFVIGCAAPDRTRLLPSGSAAIGFGGGAWEGQQGAVKAPGRPRRWGTLPESGRSRIRPFGRDCCQYCCQAAGQRRSQVDGCGMSVQRTDRNGRSWTTCLSLRIRRLGVRVPPSAPAKPQVRVLPWGNGRGPSLIWGPCCRGQGQLARRSAELRGRSWLAACGPRLARQRPDSCLQRTL